MSKIDAQRTELGPLRRFFLQSQEGMPSPVEARGERREHASEAFVAAAS